MIVTVLKLDLDFKVLSKQVHHHRLHVATDATAIPVGNKNQHSTVLVVRGNRK